MALLATLEDAEVLPLGGTKEANRVIKIVIQFQSVFLKGTDPAVARFMADAITARWTTRASEVETKFRREGWTSEVMDAFETRYRSLADRDRQAMAPEFLRFNVSLEDFNYLLELFRNARSAYRERGQDIHQAFAARRQQMPGASS